MVTVEAADVTLGVHRRDDPRMATQGNDPGDAFDKVTGPSGATQTVHLVMHLHEDRHVAARSRSPNWTWGMPMLAAATPAVTVLHTGMLRLPEFGCIDL